MMSNADKSRLAEQRAYSLATITLTRRADRFVSGAPEMSRLDLIVEILDDGRKVGRRFGVETAGVFMSPNISQVTRSMTSRFKHLSPPTPSFPVMLLYFCMPSDDGFFSWVVEPKVENQPTLQISELPVPHALTTKLLNEIVGIIENWYRANKPTGRDVFDTILELQKQFYAKHSKPAKLMRLPFLLAYDIAKLDADVLGDLSQRILMDGVRVLEKVGLLGMKVKLEKKLKTIVLE